MMIRRMVIVYRATGFQVDLSAGRWTLFAFDGKKMTVKWKANNRMFDQKIMDLS